jgi:hypothetical protein
MDHFAGLDVSVKQTSVCIVDDSGRIVRELTVASEPEALLVVLANPAYRFVRHRRPHCRMPNIVRNNGLLLKCQNVALWH